MTIREYACSAHAEWLGLLVWKPDIDAAVAEMEFVSAYVRTYFRLPSLAQREVEVYGR